MYKLNYNRKLFLPSFILIIIFYILIIEYSGIRYKYYLPTIKFLYPNNYIEAHQVALFSFRRTKEDENFFYYTDKSVVPAFLKIFPNMSYNKLHKISVSQNNKIFLLKNFINRPRPIQISKKIKLLKSNTGNTPAFPAGHAAQAYILANYLIKKYPEKIEIIEKIANKCNECRIKAGIHYPSDGLYSKLIFYNYYK